MKQFIFTCCFLLVRSIIYCQPGSIDPSFGDKGYVRTSAEETKFFSTGRASALQADGKILVGGQLYATTVIRYLPDGSRDSSFGENGITFVAGISGFMVDIAVQEDGKIIIAVNSSYISAKYDISTARLMPDGTADTAYGLNGVAGLDFGDYESANAIALQADGKLLLAGGAGTDPQAVIYEYGTLIRLNADGSIDNTFGEDGRTENVAANSYQALAVQPDGKIVATGSQAFTSDFIPEYVVSRYNTDGTSDNAFGSKGNTTTDGFGIDNLPESISLQPDSKILLGGYSETPYGYAMTALRYTANGTLDKDFGAGGQVYVEFEGRTSKAYQALLQPDGKIVLTGNAYSDNQFNNADFALCRLNKDGTVDSSFAINGRQITLLKTSGEEAQSALLQPDGKIVLVGYRYEDEKYSTLLIRYNGDKEQKPLLARIKRFLHNHGISWQGLNANVNYYSVQYSKTGSGFSEKGKISGAGSSNFQQYSFPIADAGYYRVVAVDRKGYKTFSNKVMVTEADAASSASVFPNPAQSYVTVQGLKTNETANISIKNANGNVMVQGVSGGTQYRSSVSHLQPGTYYMDITTKDKTETLKFVKE